MMEECYTFNNGSVCLALVTYIISTADFYLSCCIGVRKRNIGINFENKFINGSEIVLEYIIIITFKCWFSMLNICRGSLLILMPSASTLGININLEPQRDVAHLLN